MGRKIKDGASIRSAYVALAFLALMLLT